jgi:Flp pilus assembly pilin Flp
MRCFNRNSGFAHDRHDKKGVTVLEYGVLGALILVVAVTAMTGIGDRVTSAFTGIKNALPGT